MRFPDHQWKVGNVVFVVGREGPVRRTKVVAVRKFKRGPKVTTEGGNEWDPDAGRAWGHRGESWYTGEWIEPSTPKLEKQLAERFWQTHIRSIVKEWHTLSHEHRKLLGKTAIQILREREKAADPG